MTNTTEMERELEKIALAEKLEKELNALILDSRIPLLEIIRILGAEEYFERSGRGENKAGVFHFREWAREEIRKAVQKSREEDLSLDESLIKLPNSGEQINETILPPGKGEINSGSGKGIEKKKQYLRTRWLMEILSEMRLNYDLTTGKNTSTMMRGLSYSEIFIPEINKLIFVNDEEGNATYVIHGVDDGGAGAAYFRQLTKEELQELRMSGKVSYLEFNHSSSGEWKDDLKAILNKELEEIVSRGAIPENNVTPANREKLHPAPEGYLTVNGVAELLRAAPKTIKRKVVKIFPDIDLKKSNYLDGGGKPACHLTPEQIEKIREKLTEYEPAPEGYLTVNGVAKLVNSCDKTIRKRAAEIFVNIDLETPNFLDKSNRPAFYFSPEQINKMRENITVAPDGYMTAERLKSLLKISKERFNRIIADLFSGLDIKTPNYLSENGRPFFHFSREQIEEVRKKLGEYKFAPDGYLPIGTLARSCGVSWKLILKTVLDIFPDIDQRPNYLDKGNQPAFHLTPGQVEKVKEKLKEYERAPEGYLTVKGLAKLLGATFKTIKRIVVSIFPDIDLKKSNYLDRMGRPACHLTPEQIEKIKNYVQKKPQSD